MCRKINCLRKITWQKLALTGENWRELAETGANWLKLAKTG
jgi:hypothetical protein